MQPLFFNYSLGCLVLCPEFRFSDIHKIFNGLYTLFYRGPSFSRHSLVNLKVQPSQAKLLLRFAPRYRVTETLQIDDSTPYYYDKK